MAEATSGIVMIGGGRSGHWLSILGDAWAGAASLEFDVNSSERSHRFTLYEEPEGSLKCE
jgi:hypothetical protein